MRHTTKVNLGLKGWTKDEINKAETILTHPRSHDKHFSKIVFWSALIVIIIANVLISLVLIPFLIFLNTLVLYAAIILLAGMIGYLYFFLIKDIGHLDKKHHVFAGILVPLIGIANMVLMVIVTNRVIDRLQVNNVQHDPWLLGVIFAVAFTLPYILGLIFEAIQKRKAILTH